MVTSLFDKWLKLINEPGSSHDKNKTSAKETGGTEAAKRRPTCADWVDELIFKMIKDD